MRRGRGGMGEEGRGGGGVGERRGGEWEMRGEGRRKERRREEGGEVSEVI